MFTIATMEALEAGSLTEADMEQMRERVKDLRHSNAALETETVMFERHIGWLKLKVPNWDVQELLGSATLMRGISRRRKESKVQQPSQKHSELLTLEQKCAIAEKEMEELRNDLEKLEDSSETVDNDKDTLTKRLCQKNMAVCTEKQKKKLNLKHKENKTFNTVDLQQLMIENRRYMEQIDKLSQDRKRIYLQGGNTLEVFNQSKNKLQSLGHESNSLRSDISSRKDMLMKIEEQTRQAEKERAKAESENQKLRTRLSKYRVPDVLSYVEASTSHTKLEQSVRTWERKVAIAEMEFKSLTKAWNKHRDTTKATLPPN